MSDYLWDGSGPPDPDVLALEKALAPLRRKVPTVANGATSSVGVMPALADGQRNRRKAWLRMGSAAAAAAIVVALWWPRPQSDWTLPVAGDQNRHALAGETVNAAGTLQLQAAGIGSVTMEPGTRVRLGRGHQFELQKGTVHAFIWAPPGKFVIDTPAARVIDLGCQYTLSMNEDGSGLLTVQTGWVAFQTGARESFIPAGAACRVDARRGPGTPYRQSSEAVQQALLRLEAGLPGALAAVLAAAGAEDGLTLWHLLSRAESQDRAAIIDRLLELRKLPATLRQPVMEGRAEALDAVWNALELGETAWWRTWKRPWSSAPQTPSGALH